jgi:hypothetical protein
MSAATCCLKQRSLNNLFAHGAHGLISEHLSGSVQPQHFSIRQCCLRGEIARRWGFIPLERILVLVFKLARLKVPESTSSPVSASTLRYLMRWPVLLLS